MAEVLKNDILKKQNELDDKRDCLITKMKDFYKTKIDLDKENQKETNAITKDISKLVKKNEILKDTINNVSNISNEINDSLKNLRVKKSNTEDCVNKQSAISNFDAQYKEMKEQNENFEKKDANAVLKVVKEIYHVKMQIPEEYFSEKLKDLENTECIVKEKIKIALENAMINKQIKSVDCYLELLKLLGEESKNSERYFEIFLQDFEEKINAIFGSLNTKLEKFKSIKDFVDSDDSSKFKKLGDSTYPKFFLNKILDFLTMAYESIESNMENNLFVSSSINLKNFLDILTGKRFDLFLEKMVKKMLDFFEINIEKYFQDNEKVSIEVISQNEYNRNPENSTRKMLQIAEINEKEQLLSEMMEISEQIELWKDHIISQIYQVVQRKDYLKDEKSWQKDEIIRNFNAKNFNTIIFGIMEKFKMLQEVILKKKVSVIISNSTTVRRLFYDSPELLQTTSFRKMSIDSADSSEIDESSGFNPNDYLDEYFFILEESSFRVIKTLNKVSIITILNFISNTIIGSDLLRIISALLQRFNSKENFGGARGINLESDGSAINFCVGMMLNSLQAINEFITRLKGRLIEKLDKTFLDLRNRAIGSSPNNDVYYSAINDLEITNVRKFEEKIREAIHDLSENLTSTYIGHYINQYKTFNFVCSEASISLYDDNQEKYSLALKISSKLQDGLMSWHGYLLRENYEKFCCAIAKYLFDMIEKIILGIKINQLGALIFDRELKIMSAVFSDNIDVQNLKALQRLALYAEILMLDTKHEFEQYLSVSGEEIIKKEQINDLIKLRVDFN